MLLPFSAMELDLYRAHVGGTRAVLGCELLCPDGDISDLEVRHEPIPGHLDGINGRADGPTPSLDEDLLLPALEQGHTGQHVVQHGFPADENGVRSRHFDSSKYLIRLGVL